MMSSLSSSLPCRRCAMLAPLEIRAGVALVIAPLGDALVVALIVCLLVGLVLDPLSKQL